MNEKKIAWLLRIAIICIGLFGIAVCAFWWPFSISLTSEVGLAYDKADVTVAETVEFWVQFIFYEAVSIPCFVILIIAWLVTIRISRGKFLDLNTCRLINIAAKILYIDLIIFLIGNVIFRILEWNVYAVVYYLLAAVGLAMAICMTAVSYYVRKSAQLKEETEGLI